MPLYFYHRVEDVTTLLIEVLGTNLVFRFKHPRLSSLFGPRHIHRLLERKTVGFIALVQPASPTSRVVLAAAESGHGFGSYGDALDSTRGILSNRPWARRTIAMGKLLGIPLGRAFDATVRRLPGKHHLEGIFQGSHVEVKLAVHGIFALLDTFRVTRKFDEIALEHLTQLKTVLWANGARPVLEVYFSRKPCGTCRKLVEKLEDATGVAIRLLPSTRLEAKQYISRAKRRGQPPQPSPEVIEDDDDEVDEVDDDDDVMEVNPCDGNSKDGTVIETIDLTAMNGQQQQQPASDRQPSLLDDFLNGLADRVNGMDSSPGGAAETIIQFAEKMQRQRRWAREQAQMNVDKPLPPTPVMEAPLWMAAASSLQTSFGSQGDLDTQTTITTTSYEDGSSISEERERSVSIEAVPMCRSPRPYAISQGEPADTTAGERRRSHIRVEIPARQAT